MQSQTTINRTKKWLTQSVIKYQFCPYAKQPYEQNTIGYHTYTGDNIMGLMEIITRCCLQLDAQDKTALETSLVIVANDDSDYLTDFYDYLDALDIANSFLHNPQVLLPHFSDELIRNHAAAIPTSWAEKYQIASFHPDYQFEGTTAEDLENFTNRSPYPIFHLIRNDSIEAVRMNDERAEKIVEQNKTTIKELNTKQINFLFNMAKHQTQ